MEARKSEDGIIWELVWEITENLPVGDTTPFFNRNYISKYFEVMILRNGSMVFCSLRLNCIF